MDVRTPPLLTYFYKMQIMIQPGHASQAMDR